MEPPVDEFTLRVRPYASETAEETANEVQATKIRPSRNLMRLEFIKKRKDFNQPVKFTDTDSDKNIHFLPFKDDILQLRENKVLEVG